MYSVPFDKYLQCKNLFDRVGFVWLYLWYMAFEYIKLQVQM